MRKIVGLSGGLGNQLFQIAGAISVYKDANFSVEWSTGITNVNESGVPEISDYILPETIHMLPKQKPTKLQRKLAHLVLRRSSSRREFPSNFLMWVIACVLSLCLVPYLKILPKVVFPKSLDSNFVVSRRNRPEYLIGFFHSSLWINKIVDELMLNGLEPRTTDEYVLELQKMAVLKKPVIVHIRLGDYEKESDFGILPSKYYEKSLDALFELGFTSEIWIFTNDPIKAKEIFPKKYESRANWIPDFSKSSVQVLEAMRLGSAYVVGNSTFSWWAAKLARDKHAVVVAPNPWFKSASTHNDLIPNNWISINPWSSQTTN